MKQRKQVQLGLETRWIISYLESVLRCDAIEVAECDVIEVVAVE
jgi:hypothetical protein